MKLKSMFFVVTFCILVSSMPGVLKARMIEVSMNVQAGEQYHKITPQQAKQMMDQGTYDVIIDVRMKNDYEAGHIKNAINIPEPEIERYAQNALKNKDLVILVYCQSGQKSKSASKKLVRMGYSKVYNLGGIKDWSYELTTN